MKFRMLAVTLAFAMAAWLPLAGQQTPGQSTPQTPATQDSTKDAGKHSCCCANENHDADRASAANHDDHAMACCNPRPPSNRLKKAKWAATRGLRPISISIPPPTLCRQV
jgi:hypothetical protein